MHKFSWASKYFIGIKSYILGKEMGKIKERLYFNAGAKNACTNCKGSGWGLAADEQKVNCLPPKRKVRLVFGLSKR